MCSSDLAAGGNVTGEQASQIMLGKAGHAEAVKSTNETIAEANAALAQVQAAQDEAKKLLEPSK